MKTLSVIIPVYNKVPFLKRALDSIAKQITDDVQVIVIDDGSTDGSGAICDEYKPAGFEVYHQQNGGVSVARNFGLRKAEGRYITFLDADDAYTSDALEVMTKIARHGMDVVQFGQYRCHAIRTVKDPVRKGKFSADRLPRRWPMVWNKMYKRRFIEENKIDFPVGMQFGEDEIFSAKAILTNGGLYHAPQTLIYHHFDDKKSLCRGELSVELLAKLVEKLKEMAEAEPDRTKKLWLKNKARQHELSPLFKKFDYRAVEPTGRWDVVYFLKNTTENEELRYSLRSIERNWEYKSVWFYGGRPRGIRPNHHVPMTQTAASKWERVRHMILSACFNDDITENFWLFNDDFFILKPTPEDIPQQYNGTLERQIERVERRHGGRATDYTRRLRHLVETLKKDGHPTLNYSVHKPILVNRKKAVEVLMKYPNEPMFRALYGNYWKIGGEDMVDHKIMVKGYDVRKIDKWDFVSTSDESFRFGTVGSYLRDKFKDKSRFEN